MRSIRWGSSNISTTKLCTSAPTSQSTMCKESSIDCRTWKNLNSVSRDWSTFSVILTTNLIQRKNKTLATRPRTRRSKNQTFKKSQMNRQRKLNRRRRKDLMSWKRNVRMRCTQDSKKKEPLIWVTWSIKMRRSRRKMKEQEEFFKVLITQRLKYISYRTMSTKSSRNKSIKTILI